MAKELLAVRADEEDIASFKQKCVDLDKDHNDMLRELVNAFAEGRVSIIPSKAQLKQRRELEK